MQQSCQHCSYISPASARFCRQCGATLFVETEISAATTRNYGSPDLAPARASTGSGHLPPSVADVIAGETERYYTPPPMPAPPTPNTAPIHSRFKSWRWAALLLVLLFGMMIGALLTKPRRRPVPNFPPQEFPQEARRRPGDLEGKVEDRIHEAERRAQRALQLQQDLLKRAQKAAEEASRAGVAYAVGTEKPLDLNPYKYPNATVHTLVRIPGNELLTMYTPDDFENLIQFYQKKFGEPIVQINGVEEKKLIFQSSTVPSIVVSIENDDELNGQYGKYKIVVLRWPFPNSKPDPGPNRD